MKHYTVTFKPEGKSISIHSGATILEAAAQTGIILNSVCGGSGTCRKCGVQLEPEGNEVLACQYHIESDLVVFIPKIARFFQQRILQHGIDRQIEVAPSIRKQFLTPTEKSVKALESALKVSEPEHIYQISSDVAKQLDSISLDNGITAVCRRINGCGDSESQKHCYKCLCIEAGDTTDRLFGIALDIGTTTVVAKLIDMSDGQCKATAATINPQITHGDDVISRISYGQTEEGLKELHDVIIKCVNSLIEQLCAQVSVDWSHIYEISVAGNTAMNHLFLRFPVKQLGQAPYEAYSVDAHDRVAQQMGLRINNCSNIHTIENMAGFIGSDTTAVMVSVGLEAFEEMTLVVDIGTNGELVLGCGEKLYSASCAAGPALEGARISCGSRAVDGAIERVIINEDDIDLDVIGNSAPRSICGSGLIDTMAVLLDLGLVNETGRFVEPVELKDKVPALILARFTEKNGQPGFILAHNKDNDNEPVIFTQKDIRETQLAKAAIRAGIRLLQEKVGIEDFDIGQILLAGAFGNYIQRRSAWRIGLLPNVPLERIHFIGNAASTGAEMILLSNECRQLASKLVNKIGYIEIAHHPQFQMVFAESLMFENLT